MGGNYVHDLIEEAQKAEKNHNYSDAISKIEKALLYQSEEDWRVLSSYLNQLKASERSHMSSFKKDNILRVLKKY